MFYDCDVKDRTLIELSKFRWNYFRTFIVTVLQIMSRAEIDQFYKDVEALGLRFPVADISKATRFAKGQVSEYLNKKKEPSENFIRAFYKSFKIGSTNVSRETSLVQPRQDARTTDFRSKGKVKPDAQESPVNSSHDYKEKYITLLEKENERKAQIIEVNLTGLLVGQKSILSHLAVSLEYDALRDANGNGVKAGKIKERMDTRIGEVFSGVKKMDKTSDKKHSKA